MAIQDFLGFRISWVRRSPAAARSCEELTRSCEELSGAGKWTKGRQKPNSETRACIYACLRGRGGLFLGWGVRVSCQELPGAWEAAPGRWHELPGACQEMPRAATRPQELPRPRRSCRVAGPCAFLRCAHFNNVLQETRPPGAFPSRGCPGELNSYIIIIRK